MRFALLNGFPNLRVTAEREFIQRCLPILNRLGHQAVEVATSDEITRFNPDCVIVTHELVPKLTSHFTVGLFWSPLYFSQYDPARLQAVRSWDLVVSVNDTLRNFARDLRFPFKPSSSVSPLDFYPSSPAIDLKIPDHSKLSLAYVGVHWDGDRHRPLLEALARQTELHVYGPPDAWSFIGEAYRGPLPVDGNAVISTLNRHGAVLAIHKDTHVAENTPSMRVFEACAARCLVLTDPLPALKTMFGDGLSYINVGRDPEIMAGGIANYLARMRADRKGFHSIVEFVHETFKSKASLDVLVPALIQEIEQRLPPKIRPIASLPADVVSTDADVTVIIRCGARPLAMIKRAVASLVAQSHRRIGIVFARFDFIEGFDEWRRSLLDEGRFLFVEEIICEGGGVRSIAMWAGLRAVKTPLFCMLDDDDEIFTDHLSKLVAVLGKYPDTDIAYSGTIRHMEDLDSTASQNRLEGDLDRDIRERRTIEFLDDFDLDRLLRLDSFIASNAWLARKTILDEDLLEDPALEVAEDLYFLLLAASRYTFRFSGSTSAVWNRHSGALENASSAVTPANWSRNLDRIIRRLSSVIFPGGHLGRDVLCRGRNRPRTAANSPPRLTSLRHFSIDFADPQMPPFMLHVRGMATSEHWGRWSLGPELRLIFRRPLPRKFRLKLIARVFGNNANKPITMKVGPNVATFEMNGKGDQRLMIDVTNNGDSDSIIFQIPNPESYFDLSQGQIMDKRLLGLGLIRLEMIETGVAASAKDSS